MTQHPQFCQIALAVLASTASWGQVPQDHPPENVVVIVDSVKQVDGTKYVVAYHTQGDGTLHVGTCGGRDCLGLREGVHLGTTTIGPDNVELNVLGGKRINILRDSAEETIVKKDIEDRRIRALSPQAEGTDSIPEPPVPAGFADTLPEAPKHPTVAKPATYDSNAAMQKTYESMKAFDTWVDSVSNQPQPTKAAKVPAYVKEVCKTLNNDTAAKRRACEANWMKDSEESDDK